MAKTQTRERNWRVPSARAKDFADELRAKVHTHGPKEGQPLTVNERCYRMGGLAMQNDHAGMYKYKKALSEGKSKQEAKKISRTIGGKK